MTTTVVSELSDRFTKQQVIDGYSPLDGSTSITTVQLQQVKYQPM